MAGFVGHVSDLDDDELSSLEFQFEKFMPDIVENEKVRLTESVETDEDSPAVKLMKLKYGKLGMRVRR